MIQKKIVKLMNELNSMLKSQEVIDDKLTYNKLDKIYWKLNEVRNTFSEISELNRPL